MTDWNFKTTKAIVLLLFLLLLPLTHSQKLIGKKNKIIILHFILKLFNFNFLAKAVSKSLGNCYPMGVYGSWGSYMFFQYSNLPAATILPGDILGFDLGSPNDYVPAYASIAFATPTEDSAGTYTIVVPDSAASSAGDTIYDNFEVKFTITNQYNFPGGNLIIRFQNGGIAASNTGYSSDSSCSQVHVYGSYGDASG